MAVPTSPPRLKAAIPAAFRLQRKNILVVIVLGLSIFSIALIFLATRWPFRESRIVKRLEEAGAGKVEIKSFRETYLPYPGCVAWGVTYRLSAAGPAFATVDTLTIQSNYFELFAGRLHLIEADGLHVYVPGHDSKERFSGLKPGSTGIDGIAIRNAALTVPRKEAGKPSVEFLIHELLLGSITLDRGIHFSAALSNPEPPGEITASGEFGPWKNLQTPVSGEYNFENADLGEFEGIRGILSSQGRFSGALGHINVSGNIDIPDFEVKSGKHPVRMKSEFDAFVNGANGDTFLNRVSSHFPNTTVVSKGKITGKPGAKGKTAAIDLQANDGRIEDILRLFNKDPKPPMAGEINFKGHSVLPPGEDRFLKKVELEGDFGISDSSFTRPATQEKVDQLSQSAQTETRKPENAGEPAPPVLSDLKGHIVLKNGIATFSNLSFYIPGAHAQMHGTYSLITEKIDMHGTLKMDADLSDTAHGARAVILKVLDPFFKKRRGKGSDVPVRVSGTYHAPSFGMDVGNASKRLLSGGRSAK